MSDEPELPARVRELEEQQMFLERQIEVLSGEVRELSKLLELARVQLRRLESDMKDKDGSEGTGSAEE